MKIAIPTNGGKLCQHFGHCEVFTFIEVDDTTKQIINREEITPPEHVPGIIPPWVAEQGAKLVIAGGMGGRRHGLHRHRLRAGLHDRLGLRACHQALETRPSAGRSADRVRRPGQGRERLGVGGPHTGL